MVTVIVNGELGVGIQLNWANLTEFVRTAHTMDGNSVLLDLVPECVDPCGELGPFAQATVTVAWVPGPWVIRHGQYLVQWADGKWTLMDPEDVARYKI